MGGARNEDFDGETSGVLEITSNIQAALERFLEKYILPSTPFSISDRWSGIMAMGKEKLPIVKEIEPNVFCSVRMSGMGVALAPVVAQQVTNMMID